MTCPNCDDDCSFGHECECDCHDDESEAIVYENQMIEYEVDSHLPDGSVITKKRVMVTGRTIAEAHEQFDRVMTRVK